MTKRLYKSTEKKLCGVCGGIADYFNIDPTWIRLAWIILTAVSSAFPGIMAYIVCAFVMPERPFRQDDWEHLKRANSDGASAAGSSPERDAEFDSYFTKEN